MSDLFAILLNVISPIFIVAGFGVFVGRRWNPDTRVLSLLLVYVLVPALVMNGIRTSQMRPNDLLRVGLLMAVLVAALTAVSLAAARFLRLDPQKRGAFMLTTLMMNAANYGVPVNRFAFGSVGEQTAIVFYVLNNLIGNVVALGFAAGGRSVARALVGILKVPIMYAALIGLALNLFDLDLALPVERSLTIIADGTIPAMLFLLGLQLAHTPMRGRLRLVIMGCVIRLVISPMIALPLALLGGLQGAMLAAFVVQSGMPNAVLANAIAAEFHSDREYVALMTLVSTLASTLTLSVIIALLTPIANAGLPS
jgi:predicted permease